MNSFERINLALVFLHLVLKARSFTISFIGSFSLFNLRLFNLLKLQHSLSHKTVKLKDLSLLWVCAEVYVLDGYFGDRKSFCRYCTVEIYT